MQINQLDKKKNRKDESPFLFANFSLDIFNGWSRSAFIFLYKSKFFSKLESIWMGMGDCYNLPYLNCAHFF
jgi:hypothetical protein